MGTCLKRTAAQLNLPGKPAEKTRILHCAADLFTQAVLFTQVPKKFTDLDPSLLYMLISGKYDKFTLKNNSLALGVDFPQTCSSAGRMFAESRSRLHYYTQIVSFPQ